MYRLSNVLQYIMTNSVSPGQTAKVYMCGRSYVPLPGTLISVLECKAQPLVDDLSQRGEKVRGLTPEFSPRVLLA